MKEPDGEHIAMKTPWSPELSASSGVYADREFAISLFRLRDLRGSW